MQICQNCGNQVPDGQTYCPFCGRSTLPNYAPPPPLMEAQRPKAERWGARKYAGVFLIILGIVICVVFCWIGWELGNSVDLWVFPALGVMILGACWSYAASLFKDKKTDEDLPLTSLSTEPTPQPPGFVSTRTTEPAMTMHGEQQSYPMEPIRTQEAEITGHPGQRPGVTTAQGYRPEPNEPQQPQERYPAQSAQPYQYPQPQQQQYQHQYQPTPYQYQPQAQPEQEYQQQYQPAQQTYPCPTCRQPLTFINEYKSWYCYSCGRYV